MESLDIEISLVRPDSKVPYRATTGSAGADLFADVPEPITVNPGEIVSVPTGVKIAIPQGYAGYIFGRSSLGIKHNLSPANCVGVIDSDYRGELLVGLGNYSNTPYTINPGDRFAQLVILQTPANISFKVCDNLDDTDRGEGGFGSTGQK